MEVLKEDRDTPENAIKFMDSISKALEGLKDKSFKMISESESKNEKPDNTLKAWVSGAYEIIKEKWEEVYDSQYDEANFQSILKSW